MEFGVMRRRYGLLFLLMFLISCGECQPADEIKHISSASGTPNGCQSEPICEVGLRRCSDERTPAVCKLDKEGCAYWDEPKAEICQDIQWCYNGGCFNADEVSLPQSPPTGYSSIVEMTTHEVAIDSEITVIPYEAFINAIRMDQQYDEAQADQSMLAADVVMKGNDPNVLGVTTYMQPADEFSGDVFLVMIDPTYSPATAGGAQSQTMPLIESKRYFLAVMPGLRGHTTYVGHMSVQRAIVNSPFPTTCCNDPSQPPKSGGFGQPGAGPLPDGPCPQDMPDCGFDGPLAQLIQHDPTKQPFRTGTEAQLIVDPDQISPKLQLRGNGMPAVYMYNSMGIDWHQNQFNHSPTGPLSPNAVYYPIEMRFPPVLYLDWCSQALCKVDQPITNALENNNASDLCGNATLGGHDIPEACKAMTPDPRNAHPNCGGALFGMGGESLPEGLCHHTIGTHNLDTSATVQCGGNGMPSFCKWATKCDEFCDATCQQKQKDFWREFYGCTGVGGLAPTGSAVGNVTCTENGVCKTLSNGAEQCLECNEAGGCQTTIRSNPLEPDARYFDGGHSGKRFESNTDNDSCVPTCSIGPTYIDGQTQPTTPVGDGPPVKNDQGNVDQSDAKKGKDKQVLVQATNKATKGGQSKETKNEQVINNNKDKASPTDKGGSDDDDNRVLDVDWIAEKFLAPPQKGFEDPLAPGKKPSSVTRTPKRGDPNQKNATAKEKEDPVILASGSLSVEQVDLRYPGPVRALTFERYYDSQSEARSILGSNWTHNYDMRIEPITPGNIPDWAPKYCVATSPRLTCAFVHYPGGYSKLFVKSPGDPNNLFYPQAGSAETLRFDTDEWQLRNVEGHMWLFNQFGYLIQDRDRFGNGVTIVYEHTPLHRAFRYACLARGKRLNIPIDLGNQGNTDPNATVNAKNYNRRTCRALASALGDQPELEVSSNGFETLDTDTNTPFLGLPPVTPNNSSGLSLTDWVYVQWWLQQDVNVRPLTGEHKMRPKFVIDDLGRKLTFNYYTDVPQSVGPALPSEQGQQTYGLLKEVVGPDGITTISYQYERPPQYPVRLQESFLTQIQRTDNVTGQGLVAQPVKTLSLDYGWNTDPNWLANYDGYADDLYTRYLNYFGTFTGCNWYADGNQTGSGATVCTNGSTAGPSAGFFVCNNNALPASGQSTSNCWAPGASRQGHNPCYLARRERERYISRVADNIQIIKRNHIVEVKSKYQPDPDQPDFDRVTHQRYGGLIAPVDNHDWSSGNEPEATFKYISVKPYDNGQKDTTTLQLPTEIADRYTLESSPISWEPLPECIVDGSCKEGDANAPTPSCQEDQHTNAAIFDPSNTCNANNNLRYYNELPGVFKTWKYYASVEANSPTQFPKLYRSRLTCEQLSAQLVADPSHNGTMKRLNQAEHVWDHVADDRARIEADLRRICAWVEVKDRDGDVTLSGLNFKGQSIVEAAQVDGQWLVSEMIVNADGLVLQKRKVRPASRDWTTADGYTEHEYMDLDGVDDQGNPTWRAFWWMKRFNRVLTTEHPNTQGSEPSFVHDYTFNGLFSGQALLTRAIELTYEPLFNQVQSVTSSVETTTGSQMTGQIIYDFDYQELDPDSPEFTEAVMSAHRWGLHLPPSIRPMLDKTLREQSGPTSTWRDWLKQEHINMTFYPNQDINGDGVMGFVNYATISEDAYSARGFPIRMTVINPKADASTPSFDQYKQSYIWPSPQGMPNRVIESNGTQTILEYYSLTETPYGQLQPLADAPSGINYRGFLGRVLTQRVNPDYPADQEGGFDAPLHQSVCDALKGPYQWVLPQGCNQGAQSALTELGVPVEVQDELLAISNPQENWKVTTLSYNETGHVHKVYNNGRTTTLVRDSDGRVMKRIDPLDNMTMITRDLDGRPIIIEHKTAAGQLLSKLRAQYDTEGRLIARCTVVDSNSPAACDGFGWSAPLAMNSPRDPSSPTYLLDTYRYSNTGLLNQAIDAMGHEVQMTYDARGLLKSKVFVDPNGTDRQTRWHYDSRGRKVRVQYGTQATYQAENRDAFFVYDGFDRLVQYTDESGVPWQMAWDAMGQVSAYKQDGAMYRALSPSAQPTATWEVWSAYDGFGRLSAQRTHNLSMAAYGYGPMGRVRHIKHHPVASAQGGSQVWLSYDASGQLVWRADHQGNQVFTTWDPIAQRRTVTQVSVDSEDLTKKHVTSQLLDMDVLGHLKTQTVLGQAGEVQTTQLIHNPRGELLSVTTPLGHTTAFTRNLLGWSTQLAQPNDQAQSSVSTYEYDAYGQVIQLTEPGSPGGVTKYTYNRFGELKTRELPHAPGVVHDAYAYDGFGRLSQLEQYDGGQMARRLNISYQLQSNGVEQVRTMLDGTNTELMLRRHDALGRVIFSESNNVALSDLLGASIPTRARVQYQYDALGRVLEETQSLYQDSTLLWQKSTESTHQVDVHGNWQRQVKYPSGSIHTRQSDTLGRLKQIIESNRQGSAINPQLTTFNWLGGMYKGRAQGYMLQNGGVVPDPIREQRQFDGLGRSTQIQYGALDFNGGNQPINTTWAQQYCQGPWQADCGQHLARLEMKYDLASQLKSVRRRFDHPMFSGALLSNDTHKANWKGYQYNARGHLKGQWHVEDLTNAQHDIIQNHSVGSADLEQVGYPNGAGHKLNFNREQGVGDLLSITRADDNSVLWAHKDAQGQSSYYKPGHQFNQVDVDGLGQQPILYDGRGRVIQDTNFEYAYDAFDRLIAARAIGQSDWAETYVYDGLHRLVEVATNGHSKRLVYDDAQMIASYDGEQLSWEALWGPGLDQLLLWRDVENNKDYIPLTDHRNNVVSLYNASEGKMAQLFDWSATGRLSIMDANEQVQCQEQGTGQVCLPLSGAFPFGFNTSWRSGLTGLNNMRMRWYSPKLGSFTSPDPLEYIDSYNTYAFAGFDPINGWDPFGMNKNGFINKAKRALSAANNHRKKAVDTLADAIVGSQPKWLLTGADIASRWVGEQAKDLGDEAEGWVPDVNPGDSKAKEAAKVTLRAGVEIYRVLTPQDGDKALEDAAFTVATLGLGAFISPAIKGAKSAKKAVTKPCSFTQGTQVQMCDGSHKNIEDVEVGDSVLSKNEYTGEQSCKPVTQTFSRTAHNIYELVVLDEASSEQLIIFATGEHPFFVVGTSTPVDVDNLFIGERLFNKDNRVFSLVSKRLLSQSRNVYNFAVADYHTYFIEGGFWVHNCDVKDLRQFKADLKKWIQSGLAGYPKATVHPKSGARGYSVGMGPDRFQPDPKLYHKFIDENNQTLTNFMEDLTKWPNIDNPPKGSTMSSLEAVAKAEPEIREALSKIPKVLEDLKAAGINRETIQSWANFYKFQQAINPVRAGSRKGNVNAGPRYRHMQAIADAMERAEKLSKK